MIETCGLNRNRLSWKSNSQEHVKYVKAGDAVYDDNYIYVLTFSEKGERIEVIAEDGQSVCEIPTGNIEMIPEGLEYHPVHGAGITCRTPRGNVFCKVLSGQLREILRKDR